MQTRMIQIKKIKVGKGKRRLNEAHVGQLMQSTETEETMVPQASRGDAR